MPEQASKHIVILSIHSRQVGEAEITTETTVGDVLASLKLGPPYVLSKTRRGTPLKLEDKVFRAASKAGRLYAWCHQRMEQMELPLG